MCELYDHVTNKLSYTANIPGVNYMTMFAQYMIRINLATQHIYFRSVLCFLKQVRSVLYDHVCTVYIYLVSEFPGCLVLFITFLNTQLAYILTANDQLCIAVNPCKSLHFLLKHAVLTCLFWCSL